MLNNKFYYIYKNMLSRCSNPNNPNYNNYGGRGIKVCSRWLKYENFEDDMYDEYGYYLEKNYDSNRNIIFTLDRIDNNKGYSKENCKWSTMKEQCNNRRINKIKRTLTPEEIEIRRINAIRKTKKWVENNRDKYKKYMHNYYLRNKLAL